MLYSSLNLPKDISNKPSSQLHLSARSLLKIIRLSRTIADLDSSTDIKIQHLSEAISFNQS
ncbi:MAG: hypothetical protein ACFNPW_01455 [Candidatus Nanosyncoccus sp.]